MQERSVQGEETLNAVRLHVGGLGPAVLSSDLARTFSSLVHVSEVDIVRSKGRSFGYITIKAAPQDVKRLFSLYNGCMWKGGRLKLEIAREFYKDKLHREWAEDDDLRSQNVIKSDSISKGSKPPRLKTSSVLYIYFPKFKKIKKITEKGLGKHKRSFERVEPLAHSLLTLCNCDQDCKATCGYQSSVKGEAVNMDIEASGQDVMNPRIKNIKNKWISERQRSLQQSRKHGKEVLGAKLKERDEIQNNKAISLDNDMNMNIEGGKPNSETFDAEGTVNFHEPLLNVTGLMSPDGCEKNLQDQMLQGGEAQTKSSQRMQKNNEQDLFSRKESVPRYDNIEKVEWQISQGQGLIESNFSRSLRGKNWIQKAPWKSLVGGTGQVPFTLGSILGQEQHSDTSGLIDKLR